MQKNGFYQLFIDELRDLYSAENQLIQALPKMIQAATHEDLREAFQNHLEETKMQADRLRKIFNTLNENPSGENCEAMEGLIREADDLQKKDFPSIVRDAALISAAQRIEHYEIAAYGVAKTFAKHLDYSDIASMLKESLNEESSADKKLTSIAEGGFFSSGINALAVKG